MPEATIAEPRRSSRITKTAARILAYVGVHEGEPCAKAEIAEAVGCNVKTVDRLVSRLRSDGLLLVEPQWAKNGGQIANAYRLPRTSDSQDPSR